jgi:hemolysin III
MDWLPVREPVSALTHFAWMVLAFPATWTLWRLSRGGGPRKRVGLLVFGCTLAICYAGSGLYHSVPERLAGPFRTLDHIGIYLLIAGTVTPIALVVLPGRWRVALLSAIWTLALAGIVLRLATPLSIHVLTVFYLFMGWLGCATYFELLKYLSPARVRLIVWGGVLYSVGAVINAFDWPTLDPPLFGPHELFHLFVMGGSAVHYYFMLVAVLPYRRLAAQPEAAGVAPAALSAAPAPGQLRPAPSTGPAWPPGGLSRS